MAESPGHIPVDRLARLQERRNAKPGSTEGKPRALRSPEPASSTGRRRRPPAGASRALVAGLSTSGTFLMVAAMVHSEQRSTARTVQFTTDTSPPTSVSPVTPSTIYRVIYRAAPAGAVAAGADKPGLGGPARPAIVASASTASASKASTAVAVTGRGAVPATSPVRSTPTTAAPKPAAPPVATSCGSHC